MLQPDGAMIRLGDSPDFLRAREDLEGRLAAAGLPGPQAPGWLPGSTSVWRYPDSGYVIFRTTEATPRHLFVDLSPQLHSHGHYDATSFTYFDAGVPWVVDAGGPYLYGDSPWRAYVVSSRAHNVCQPRGRDQIDGDTELLAVREDVGTAEILARTFVDGAGYDHVRRLATTEERLLVVTDWLAHGEDELALECFLQVGEDARVELTGDGTTARLDRGGRIAWIAVAGREARVEAIRGGRHPLLGWASPHDGKMVPATTLYYTARGPGAVSLVLGPDRQSVERIRDQLRARPPLPAYRG
jgi:hypothetical protein